MLKVFSNPFRTYQACIQDSKSHLSEGIQRIKNLQAINGNSQVEEVRSLVELLEKRLRWMQWTIPIPLFPGEAKHFFGICQLGGMGNESSAVDGLTGLNNRTVFDMRLREQVGMALRGNHQFALLMLDLDHFKNVNDSYGHLTGDRALQWAANVLKSTCRDSNACCRYGGEELAVIAPSTSSSEALALASRLHNALRQKQFIPTFSSNEDEQKQIVQELSDLNLTMSIGVYSPDIDSFNGSITDEDKKSIAQNTIKMADQALYKIKHNPTNSRNGTCLIGGKSEFAFHHQTDLTNS